MSFYPRRDDDLPLFASRPPAGAGGGDAAPTSDRLPMHAVPDVPAQASLPASGPRPEEPESSLASSAIATEPAAGGQKSSREGFSHPAEERIFDDIAWHGAQGATCEEITGRQQIRYESVAAFVRDLLRSGKIVDSGRRRKTAAGRDARVVVIAADPKGRAE